jgi:hypothetical protein
MRHPPNKRKDAVRGLRKRHDQFYSLEAKKDKKNITT